MLCVLSGTYDISLLGGECSRNISCVVDQEMPGTSIPETETETETELENFTDSQEDEYEIQYVKQQSRMSTEQSNVSNVESFCRTGDSVKPFAYIDENILSAGRSISTQHLTEIYGLNGEDRRNRYYMKGIIQKEYGDKVIFLTASAKEPQVALRAISHAPDEIFHRNNKEAILRQAAGILREDIDQFLRCEIQSKIVWPPTYESLKSTRDRFPQSLSLFFTTILKNKKHIASETVSRHVDSLVQDVINSLSNGTIPTLKHTLIDCGIHSLTGSKKTIKILNKLNNSCTYDRVRQIETAQAELAQEFAFGQFPLPLVPKDEFSKVLIRFWWDNFDSLKENKTGPIHTCHGVAYTEKSDEAIERDFDINIPKSNRRSIDPVEIELPKKKIFPHKEPPLFDCIIPVTHDDSYTAALILIWKLPRLLHSSNQKVSYRFVGWVSSTLKTYGDSKTTITFLPVIRNPITDFSTVIESIYQSQKYAAKCNMIYTHITTDAGAAAKFYQVVWNNPIEFKNVLIHLGDFHAMQELFTIIGKVVKGSGFEDILYQVDLCTTGGIRGVIAGKHYNRSWAVHECLSEAIFRLFMNKVCNQLAISSSLENLLKNVTDVESCRNLVEQPDFIEFRSNYDNLVNHYLNGGKGATGQYWMFYLRLVSLLHAFHYSINMNDYHLRLNCWKRLVSLCFPTNKRNYARYGSYYVLMLENLSVTHPGAIEELADKGISVRRNTFGIGQSIDGAGEQTFMKSAKTSGGIENFTTQAGTYDKWVLSRPFQAKLVEALLEIVGLDDKDSSKKCLRNSEISKSEIRISNLKNVLTDTFMSPFSDELDNGKLYNITSGCPASDEIARCLLTIEERGLDLHSEFAKWLHEDDQSGNSFWNPIKMVKWHDFSNNEKKTKLKSSAGKTVEMAVQRDILGFLLAKSQ